MNNKNNQKWTKIIERQMKKIRCINRNYETKEIIRRIILIIIPVSFPFTWIFFAKLLNSYFSKRGGYGIECFIVLFFTLIPVYSFIYGIGTLKIKRKKFLAWYNSISSVLCACVSYHIAFSNPLPSVLLKYVCELFFWITLWTFLPIWIHSLWTFLLIWIRNLKTKCRTETDDNEATDDFDVTIQQSDTTSKKQIQENKDLPEAFSRSRNSLKQTIKTILQIVIPLLLPYAYDYFISFMNSSTNNPNTIIILIITFFSVYCSIYGLFSIECKKRKYFLWYNVIVTIIGFYFSLAFDRQYRIAKDCIKEYMSLFFYLLAFYTFFPSWINKAINKHRYEKKEASKTIEKTSTITEESPSISEEDKTDSEQ